ncbi:Fc.00g001780.m01.CDS01 [Cosmosporella sp. VM-42]
MSSTKTIAYLGASGGCGLQSLKRAVAANHTCIALCRTPSKMDVNFPSKPANLIVKPGNAHDIDAVAACLTVPGNPTQLVDAISFTIGGAFNFSKMSIDDPDVCKKGMAVLLEALNKLRREGAQGQPLLVVISTTGISEHAKDVPLLFRPMYSFMLKMPHEDKKVMEKTLVASPERWVMVRPSFLCDGEKPERKIRVGVEDPAKGVERSEVGYVISREDVGRWMFEELLNKDARDYEGKAVSITW